MPRGVKTARSVNRTVKRELVTSDDDQAYGVVTRLLGNSRVEVNMIQDSAFVECRCTIRGSMRRREWVHVNDIVLISLRDFGDTHDVILRYTDDEVQMLKRIGELVLPTDKDQEEEDVEIVFEDVDDI